VKRGKPDSVGRPEQPLVNPYHVNPHPCSSCPYAKSTPPGVWAEHEYEKLRRFDEGYQFIPEMSTFLCHQTTATGVDTLCRGWLTVHRETPACRILAMSGHISWDELYREPVVELYESGAAAADAGQAAIKKPGTRAKKMVKRLMTKGIGLKERDQ
jgi:hypothetical protein